MTIPVAYRFVNVLSLDVAAGSVSSAIFFASVSGRPLDVPALLVLACTVWCVYTLDHVRDAASAESKPSGTRHAFAHRHARVLMAAAFFNAAGTAVAAYFLASPVIAYGLFVAPFVGLYLVTQKFLAPFKELAVGLLYTAGVLAPSAPVIWTFSVAVTVIAFFLIAWMNLLVFSWFDHDNDLRDGHVSAATVLGKTRCGRIIGGVFILAVSLLPFTGNLQASLILGTMAASHIVLLRFHPYFSDGEKFRLFGDAIFFLPGFIAVLPS